MKNVSHERKQREQEEDSVNSETHLTAMVLAEFEFFPGIKNACLNRLINVKRISQIPTK